MKKPSREEYTERGAALGVDETYKYVEALEGYCEQLEKAYEDVKKGLDNACNKLEGLYLCILKEFSDDGCGGDDFDEISTLVGMRMRGCFQDAEDDETIDELIERYEECISRQ